WCQLLWRDPQFDTHLRAAAKWLAPKTDLTKDSTRYYPKVLDHAPIPNWEAYFRLPLLWYCNVDARQFIAHLYAPAQHPQPTPHPRNPPHDNNSPAPPPGPYYALMGLPPSYPPAGRPRYPNSFPRPF